MKENITTAGPGKDSEGLISIVELEPYKTRKQGKGKF